MDGSAGLGVCLALAGAAGGSVFAASGRLILGWFARHERGLAMGIRQSAQPLGVALAAVTLPTLGASGTGLAVAVPRRLLPGGGRPRCGARPRSGPRAAVAGQAAPGCCARRRHAARPRPSAAPSPYRQPDAVAHPRCQRAAGGAPVRGRDFRAGVPRRRARLEVTTAGRLLAVASCAGRRPASGPVTGRIGSAAGCGRCGYSR